MKKIISVILLSALLVLSLFNLSGCYNVRSGKMKRVQGTYELTGYSTDKDEIEARGIKLYVVIRSDGTGYYAYEDKDTPLYFAELRCRFTSDPEKSGYYSYVELNFTGDNEGWEKLGINATWREQNLNSNLPKYQGNIFEGTYGLAYYITVDFDRVSCKTDISYLESLFGKHDVKVYGGMKYDGMYSFAGVSSDDPELPTQDLEDPFVYFYLDIDVYNNRGEAWYMLKSDGARKNEKFDVRIANEDGTYAIYLGDVRATFDNRYISTYYGALCIPATVTVGDREYECCYNYTAHYVASEEDITAEIESKILEYERNAEADE